VEAKLAGPGYTIIKEMTEGKKDTLFRRASYNNAANREKKKCILVGVDRPKGIKRGGQGSQSQNRNRFL